jgi:integrase
MKWVSDGKGLQYREHPTRKHGVWSDRYYRGRYKIDGKSKTVAFGWESENRKPGRQSFRDACLQSLFELKSNARAGEGPSTLKEKRDLAKKKKEAAKRAADQEAADNITFGDFFTETYWPISSTSKKEVSCKKEMEHFRIWINPVVGALPFKKISQIQVEKIKRKMQRAKRSPRMLQYVFSTFGQVWKLAKSRGFTTADSPSKDVDFDMPDNTRKRYLTDEEAESLLSELKSKSEQVYHMAFVSLDTGARFSEVARLRWGNVDVNNGTITFLDTKKAGGTKSRAVPMTSRLRDLFKSMPMGGRSKIIFPGRDGRVLSEVSSTFKTSVNALGLNDGVEDPRMKIVFHSLRHSAASRMVQAGVDLYVVQKILGHSVITVTEKYSHLSDESLRAAVEKMERATARKPTAEVIPLAVNGEK